MKEVFILLMVLLVIPIFIGNVAYGIMQEKNPLLSFWRLSQGYWKGALIASTCAWFSYILLSSDTGSNTRAENKIALVRIFYWCITGYLSTCGFWFFSHKTTNEKIVQL